MKQDWEDQLDKLKIELGTTASGKPYCLQDDDQALEELKQFIRNLREKERKEAQERVEAERESEAGWWIGNLRFYNGQGEHSKDKRLDEIINEREKWIESLKESK